MWNRAKLRLAFCLFPCLGGACIGQGDCPTFELKYLPIKSGIYRSISEVGVEKRAVIDREAGTARFTFTSNGKQVVEIWRIAASKTR